MSGDKIKADKILNKEVRIIDYQIKESKFQEKGNGKMAKIQIEWENEKRILFLGSVPLQETITQIDKSQLPIIAKITKDKGYYELV